VGGTGGSGTAYPFGAIEFTPLFSRVRGTQSLNFLYIDRQHNGQMKDRQHNGQMKDKQHNGQMKDIQHNGQMKKDKQHNGQMKKAKQHMAK
jgi:hypothetical protein